MSSPRERLRSYGLTFDELVQSIANAITASGYPSKHADPARSEGPASETELISLLHGLGMLCEKMDADLRASNSLRLRASEDLAGFLSLYASARRLIILFRAAQESGLLVGRAAAEVDGDIDNLEQLVRRPEDPRAIIEATHWLLASAQPFRSELPEAIQDGMQELAAML